jgi:peptidoglycan glycosyltransferase
MGRAVSRRTARQLQLLMEAVVTDGTGTNAAIPGAVVGGKTGTAQHGVGNKGTPYAWFISYAKASGGGSRARVAVAVVVEDAEAARADISGGGSAAPIARAVMRSVLTSPPSRP